VADCVLSQIEDVLARKGPQLAFPAGLEAEYVAQRGPAQVRTTRRFLCFVAALHVVFLYCDYLGGIPILGMAGVIRIGICLPITLIVIFLLGRPLPDSLRNFLALTPVLTMVICVGYLARLVGGPRATDMMIGPAVCLVAQTLIAPIPFRATMYGVIASVITYCGFCLLPLPAPFSAPLVPVGPPFACAFAFGTLYERHRRERAERKDFLLSESNRLRLADILRLNAQLERLSSIDSLTGIFNRRYLDAALARLWAVAMDRERWIGVLMIDIDHFKQLNDTAGHRHGDFCLEQVAQLLQGSIRAGVDTVARYGGEEFVAILPDAGEEEVLAIGERVRASIEKANLSAANGSVVTVSAGAVAIRGGRTRLTLEEFMAAADDALYQAKRAGRNRVICSTVCV
jgi:diguanylate cyclase (GGDEF)-like protein